jgi:hypothetical protein
MIKVTKEMLEVYRTTGKHLALIDPEATLARLQAVLNLIDPVPDDVRVITDRDGDEYYRLTEGGNVWQGECGCCHDTFQQLNAGHGPITWEGKDS